MKEVIDEVNNGESDVAIGSLWQSAYAPKNVSLTYPHNQFCLTFLVPKPKLLPDTSYVFQPLNSYLWLLIIAVLLIMCFSIQLLACFHRKSKTFRHVVCTDNVALVLHGIRIFTLGSVKRTIPAALNYLRILFLAFAFTSLCLSTAYSAGFTSSLTYPRYSAPMRTIKDMLKRNIKLTAVRDVDRPIIQSYLEESPNPHVSSLAKQVISNSSDKYSSAIIVLDLDRKYITKTDYLDDYYRTHYQLLRECVKRQNVVFVLQRDSPFLQYFNEQIQRFIEHGFVDYWHRMALGESNMSFVKNFYTVYVEDYHPKPLDIKKLQGAFYLLNVGLCLGFIIFLIELIY